MKLRPAANVSGKADRFINADKFKTVLAFELFTSEALAEIPPELFEHFPSLTSVKISANIERLTPASFHGAEHLHSISLDGNRISRIPECVFAALAGLTELNLPNNGIETIDANAFEGLRNVKNLILDRNKLRTITTSMFAGLDKMEYIGLRWNEIETIESDAFRSESLLVLDLEGNRLAAIAADPFENARKIETLLLQSNRLESIHFNLPRNLKYLNISHNPIKDKIDLTELLRASNLVGVALANTTSAVALSAAKGRTFKLTALDISMNNLTGGDVLLHQMQIFGQLGSLNVECNRFETIYGLNSFQQNLPKLRAFSIGCNRFKCEWLRQQLAAVEFSFSSVRCGTSEGRNRVKGVDCD